MDFTFTPDETPTGPVIPFYEDARANLAPYYASNKSMPVAMSEVMQEFTKLDAGGVAFKRGYYTVGGQKRYGFVITFTLRDKDGLIRVAGLPIRRENPQKIEAVRLQALLNVRDWLKALVTQQTFTAGGAPLLPYLLVAPGQTVEDYILSTGKLLPAGAVYEAEYSLTK